VRYQVEQGSPSPTLYVPKAVLTAHPAEAIIAALDHHTLRLGYAATPWPN